MDNYQFEFKTNIVNYTGYDSIIPDYDIKELLNKAYDYLDKNGAFKCAELLSPRKTAEKIYSILRPITKKKDKYRNYVLIGAILHEIGVIEFKNHTLLKNIPRKEMYGRMCKFLKD